MSWATGQVSYWHSKCEKHNMKNGCKNKTPQFQFNHGYSNRGETFAEY